jgi:hypothetical protein
MRRERDGDKHKKYVYGKTSQKVGGTRKPNKKKTIF